LEINKLPGDASSRSFYRYKYKVKDEIKSLIIVKLQDKFDEDKLPYIDVQRHLKKSGLRVPEIYGFFGEEGILLIEDLGDETMERRLVASNKCEKKALYEKAIDLLIKLQIKASIPKEPKCISFFLEFDVEKFMFELEFFREHYLESLLELKINKEDITKLNNEFLKLSETLAKEPKVFSHRDYHSRNLMVVNEELAMVDFQDARMGLAQYDLASLLRDSYIVIEDSLRDELIEYYIRKIDEYFGRHTDRREFRRIFDLISVQRNIKAIGTFAHQKVKRANDHYLKYIPATLKYVRENLDKYAELKDLKDILCKYI